MGMGTFAINSYVIEYDELKKICPEEIAAIENEKFFGDVGWNVIAQWFAWDDPDQFSECIYDLYVNSEEEVDDIVEEYTQVYDKHVTNLFTAFEAKTGLTLSIDHYDEDNGDRYDNPGDEEGCIFCVGGMVQLTPAGEKYKDIITERRWTQYG
jgi:hypothetical protein